MTTLRKRLLAGAAAALLAVGLTGLLGAASWIGQPFPGFLVLGNRVVASAGLSGWPAVAGGSLYQHEVVAVEGVPLRSAEELHARVRAEPTGTHLLYRFRRGGHEFERSVATRRFEAGDFALLFGMYLLNGALLGAAALGLLWRRSPPTARAAVPLLLLGSLWALSAMDLYGPYRLFRLHALCEAFLFAGALHAALGLPEPLPLAARHPRIAWLPYALSALLALVYQLGLHHPPTYVATHLLASSGLGIGLLALIGSQLARFLGTPSPRLRRQLRTLALGAVVALTPAALLTAGEVLTGGRAPQNAVAFSAFLFPLALGHALLRGRPTACPPRPSRGAGGPP